MGGEFLCAAENCSKNGGELIDFVAAQSVLMSQAFSWLTFGANVVKGHCGGVGADCFYGVPVMPLRRKVFIFPQFRFLKVVGQWVGELSLQLLQVGFPVRLRVQPIKIAECPRRRLGTHAVR